MSSVEVELFSLHRVRDPIQMRNAKCKITYTHKKFNITVSSQDSTKISLMRQWHEMIHELIISDRTPELLCIGIQNELVFFFLEGIIDSDMTKSDDDTVLSSLTTTSPDLQEPHRILRSKEHQATQSYDRNIVKHNHEHPKSSIISPMVVSYALRTISPSPDLLSSYLYSKRNGGESPELPIL